MSIPSDRRYLESHEWHKLDGDVVIIGITQIAADELTDITFVDLPKIGQAVNSGQRFGEIESVKATSDLISGITGTVAAINTELAGNPGVVNNDPFGEGWMIKVKPADPGQIDSLLSADEYSKKVGH